MRLSRSSSSLSRAPGYRGTCAIHLRGDDDPIIPLATRIEGIMLRFEVAIAAAQYEPPHPPPKGFGRQENPERVHHKSNATRRIGDCVQRHLDVRLDRAPTAPDYLLLGFAPFTRSRVVLATNLHDHLDEVFKVLTIEEIVIQKGPPQGNRPPNIPREKAGLTVRESQHARCLSTTNTPPASGIASESFPALAFARSSFALSAYALARWL